MTRRFTVTSNAKWYVDKAPTFDRDSQRGAIYGSIAVCPGISTAALELIFPHVPLTSRLEEMRKAGFLRVEKIADLFKE